jgi:hypothetical protein
MPIIHEAGATIGAWLAVAFDENVTDRVSR